MTKLKNLSDFEQIKFTWEWVERKVFCDKEKIRKEIIKWINKYPDNPIKILVNFFEIDEEFAKKLKFLNKDKTL